MAVLIGRLCLHLGASMRDGLDYGIPWWPGRGPPSVKCKRGCPWLGCCALPTPLTAVLVGAVISSCGKGAALPVSGADRGSQ